MSFQAVLMAAAALLGFATGYRRFNRPSIFKRVKKPRELRTHQARMTNFSARKPPPLLHQLSVYVAGDTHFDDTFTVRDSTGNFLGECGAKAAVHASFAELPAAPGIVVWAFDKDALATDSAVFLTEDAYNTPDVHDALGQKATVFLAEPDMTALLDMRSLRLVARVLDVQLRPGDGPATFAQFAVEIAVWKKQDSK